MDRLYKILSDVLCEDQVAPGVLEDLAPFLQMLKTDQNWTPVLLFRKAQYQILHVVSAEMVGGARGEDIRNDFGAILEHFLILFVLLP